MNKLLIGAASVAVMAGTTAALAQLPPETTPQARAAMAARVHTRAEVASHVQYMFARVDANRDGVVTKAEAQSMRGMAGQRRGERRGQRHGQAFERIDTNRDGTVSRGEWDAHAAQRQQRMAAKGGQRGHGKAHGMGGMGAMRMGGLGGRMFDMADANRDGRLTAQEATAAALQHFDMADTNRDGQLTRDERMQMHQKMRAARQRG